MTLGKASCASRNKKEEETKKKKMGKVKKLVITTIVLSNHTQYIGSIVDVLTVLHTSCHMSACM